MSDSADGPGWWLASDGRWYPPEQHHDPGYRARWTGAVVEAAPVTAALPAPDVAPSGPSDAGPAYPSRPPYLPDGVAASVPFDRPPAVDTPAAPPVDWPVYDHPEIDAADDSATTTDRVVGVLLVVSGLVMVAAAFLPWATFDGGDYSGDLSGWSRSGFEGLPVVLAGFVVAGVGGAMAGGARSRTLRVVAVAASLLALLVFLVDLIDIALEADDLVADGVNVDLDHGYGLWLLGMAAVSSLILAVVGMAGADQSER